MVFSGMYVTFAYHPAGSYSNHAAVPSCATLTSTLILLHLLGMSSAALALVILAGAVNEQGRSALVLWEMALAPLEGEGFGVVEQTGYGATATTESTEAEAATSTAPPKRDKFEHGTVWWYSTLLLCSLGSVGSGAALVALGEQGELLTGNALLTHTSRRIPTLHSPRGQHHPLLRVLYRHAETPRDDAAQSRGRPRDRAPRPLAVLRHPSRPLPGHGPASVPQRRGDGRACRGGPVRSHPPGVLCARRADVRVARGVGVVLPSRRARLPDVRGDHAAARAARRARGRVAAPGGWGGWSEWGYERKGGQQTRS